MADVEGRWPPYWVAARLAATARDRWTIFDGWCAARGVDPVDLPPDRFCNLVYYWLVRNANDRQRADLDFWLEALPTGEDPVAADEGRWSADAEMAAFTQAQQAATSTAT